MHGINNHCAAGEACVTCHLDVTSTGSHGQDGILAVKLSVQRDILLCIHAYSIRMEYGIHGYSDAAILGCHGKVRALAVECAA